MLNKYIFEKVGELFLFVVFFATITLGSFLALIFFMLRETSIMDNIAVFGTILFLPVLVISAYLLESMRTNAKRMIAYANGNYLYSGIMRECIEQSKTAEDALSCFMEKHREQQDKEKREKEREKEKMDMQKLEEKRREFEKMKNELR